MMDPRPLKRYAVSLHSTRVGTLYQKGDWTSFELDHAYLEDRRHPILGLRFEQRADRPYSSAMRLPPWFSNLLPESPMREWIATGRGVSVDREMEILAQVGRDLPGAVAVELEEDSGLQPSTMKDDLVDGSQPWDFSLAGVALKFSMLQTGDRLTLSTRNEGGQWILKTPDPTFKNVPLNEYAMMRLASMAGIDVPRVRLVERDDVDALPANVWRRDESQAFLVERFDRLADGTRVHIEDFLQILDRYPGTKYAGSFETVAALAFRGVDIDAVTEFTRRLTFNILIGNGDAHYKNWSLIYRNPELPTLSPAYDIVSTSPYFPPGKEDLGLKLARNRQFEDARISHLALMAMRLGVDASMVVDASRDVITKALDAWPEIADLLAVDPHLQSSIHQSLSTRSRSFLSGGH